MKKELVAGTKTGTGARASTCKPDGLSLWESPGTVVKGSGYGDVTYLAWCGLEVARLARKGDRRAIRRMGGLISVGARIEGAKRELKEPGKNALAR